MTYSRYAVLLVLACAFACRSERRDDYWQGTIDTLANGTVLVTNPAPALLDSIGGETASAVLRIGKETGDPREEFTQITAFGVDQGGRMFILDGVARQVSVFDSNGAFVRSFGRQGHGPGEFVHPLGIVVLDTTVVIVDQGAGQYVLFDTAGGYVRDHPRRAAGLFSLWDGRVREAGGFYDITTLEGDPGKVAAVVIDRALVQRDTISIPEAVKGPKYAIKRSGMSIEVSVPFTATLSWTLDGKGGIWFGMTRPYELSYAKGTDTLLQVRQSYKPLPVTPEDRDRALARLAWFRKQGGVTDESRMPDEQPAFGQMVVDDHGYLWVRVVAAPSERGAIFDVFAPDGVHRRRIRFSKRIDRVLQLSGGYLYGIETDSSGVQYLVRQQAKGI